MIVDLDLDGTYLEAAFITTCGERDIPSDDLPDELTSALAALGDAVQTLAPPLAEHGHLPHLAAWLQAWSMVIDGPDRFTTGVPDYVQQREAADAAGQVRGRHYVDWIPHLNELRAAKADDESLELLGEIIDAAERVGRVHGSAPAPGYTERVAVILRRRKDYAGEVAAIERWIAACPDGMSGGTLVERLPKARSLAGLG